MKIIEHLAWHELMPGMTLAEPLFDDVGRVLLPRGCELSDSILGGLQRRGIAALTVVRVVDASEITDAARLERIKATLDERFRLAGSGPASSALYQGLLTLLTEQGDDRI